MSYVPYPIRLGRIGRVIGWQATRGCAGALALALLAPAAARAETTYKIQPIAKLGDKAGDVTLRSSGALEVGTLNDRGQLTFVAGNAAGGSVLVQYADGKLTPIVVAGQPAPSGQWSATGPITTIDAPARRNAGAMNQLGQTVFATDVVSDSTTTTGTFLWDLQAQKVTAVALKGMPATGSLTFEQGGFFGSVINNFGDIAFPAVVKNAAGQPAVGVFFRSHDGKLSAVALPDQVLPDGRKIVNAGVPDLNDSGSVAFLVQGAGESGLSAYLWQAGTITPVAVVGGDAPGGGKFAAITGVWLNNPSSSVLLTARLQSNSPGGFYRLDGGKLTPVLLPGQEMPDGGKLVGITSVSASNDDGQNAFLAVLENATAAYLLDANGKVTPILKSGTTTDLGTVTSVGPAGTQPASFGIGLNNRGQVALPLKIAGMPAMVALLTPIATQPQ
jgi:hypothetical protein